VLNNEDRWTHQITSADEFLGLWNSDEPPQVDAVVIGSGAGGAAAALELASQGLAVVILESGEFVPRQQFPDSPMQAIRSLYRFSGLTIAAGKTLIPVPVGTCVGGTTVINSGTCIRPTPSVIQSWAQAGLEEACKPLPELYDEIESALQVSTAQQPYIGAIQQVIDRGVSKLFNGKGSALPRNAVGCNGQARCQFGCPTGAKQSTLESLLPQAVKKGAMLIKQVEAEKVLWKGQQVTGIQVRNKGLHQKTTTFSIHCESVWVAAGTFATPRLLRLSGIHHPLLGKKLSIHPAGIVTARFPNLHFDHSNRIPQGYGFHHPQQPDLAFEGGTPPAFVHALSAGLSPLARNKALREYNQTAFFGFMIRDTSRGRVRYLPGSDFPFIDYNLNPQDFALFKQGIGILAEVYFQAGAESISVPALYGSRHFTQSNKLTQWLKKVTSPRDFLISAYHPLGTAAIGATAAQGVCDVHHRVFGRQGLYVVDGSTVPSSLGANPQITIMALATGAARRYICSQPY